MAALAGDRWLFADALAIVAAVFAALRYRAFAPRMRTPLSSFFGHDKPPCLSVTTSRNRRQWPWGYLTSIQMDYATHSFAAITPTNCFAPFPVFQKSVFPDCSRRSGANSGLILAIQRCEGSQSPLRSGDLMGRHSSTAITLSRHAEAFRSQGFLVDRVLPPFPIHCQPSRREGRRFDRPLQHGIGWKSYQDILVSSV